MLLQIAVTQYKDGQSCIKRLLDSIQLQQDVDFSEIGIIIINDGDELTLDTSLFSNYSFDIKYFIEEWSGLSGARQHGLDKVTAEYVMFSDGDDLFYRNNALWDILKTLKDKHPDILTSKFKTDMFKDDSQIACDYFKEYNNDNVWIHGKIFKKSWLDERNIKWNIELRGLYEDSYFVRLCFAYNPYKINIDETVWFWKYRKGSITRSDPNWIHYTYPDKMKSNAELVKQFLERKMLEQACNYVYVQAYECYFTLLEEYWSRKDLQETKENIEKCFVEYWKIFNPLFYRISINNAQVIMEVLRKRFYTDKKRLSTENITFEDWKNKLVEKYKEI